MSKVLTTLGLYVRSPPVVLNGCDRQAPANFGYDHVRRETHDRHHLRNLKD